jgi:DNA-binding SARP family transcriptional activator
MISEKAAISLRSPQSGILLLGPVAVTAADGQITGVPQLSLRVLLATLATTSSVVPVATLIDAIWQEDRSQRRVRNLHTRVYELRRWLAGTMTEARAPRIVTQPPGYQLTVADGELDVTVFGRLAGRAREALRSGDYSGSAARYRQALALWRGPALADVTETAPRLRNLAEQLEEQRLTVLTERIAADLAGGMDSELLGELTGLVQRYPFLERLRYQLMLSLYRCGRQADALAVFQDARRALREELGIDPGPELTELHQRILMADAGLTGRPAIRSPVQVSRPVPRQLPPTMTRFAGRTYELDALDRLLEQAEASRSALIVAITGGAGVGKSALALRWAHEISDRCPDGQLYVNLRGFGPSAAPPVRPMRAVRGFLDALDVPPGRAPASLEDQVALYRSLVAGKRMLMLLDNASQADQVRPLLPGGSGCVAVVTSRNDLLGLAATDDAWPLPLDVFSAAEAEELLRLRRPAEYADGASTAATELIELCARLPLALAIVLARADAHPGQSLVSLAGELRAESTRLDALDLGEESVSVRTAFSWSGRNLSESARLMFQLLPAHPGPDIDVSAAASLADITAARARAALAELTTAGLLTETAHGRYGCHELLRLYAAELRIRDS